MPRVEFRGIVAVGLSRQLDDLDVEGFGELPNNAHAV